MKRRQAPYGKRKPIVQLDDGPRASFGLGFKKDYEVNQMSPATQCEEVMTENQSTLNENDQEGSNSHEAKGLIQFVKGKETLDEMDSKLSDFLAEIDAMDVKPPAGVTNKKVEEKKANPPPKEPPAPTTAWQAVLDESSQCYYYWNMETNQSVWEMPPEYTQFLAQYKEYEQEYSKYTKEVKNWQKLRKQDTKQEISTEKTLKAENERSSPSLVPYECLDETNESMEDDTTGPVVNGTSELAKTSDDNYDYNEEEEDHRSNHCEDRLDKISNSVKRPFDFDENDFDARKRVSKRMKFVESSLPTFMIGRDEIQQQISQLEEISGLTTQIGEILKCYGEFGGTNCESPQFIYAAVQTRIEDWKAGHLSTSYFVSKLKNCLETISGWKQQVDFELPQEIENEEISADTSGPKRAETPTDLPLSYYSNEVPSTMEVRQPPPPPPDNTELFFTAPPPPPPIEDDPKPTMVPRSLISSDYGEDSDEENESEPPSPPYFGKETVDQETSHPSETVDQEASNLTEAADQGTSNLTEAADQGTLNLVEAADQETFYYVESAVSSVTKSPEAVHVLPSDNKSAFSLASGVKKTKPLSTARLSVKKVSSLVEKWQKVQREL